MAVSGAKSRASVVKMLDQEGGELLQIPLSHGVYWMTCDCCENKMVRNHVHLHLSEKGWDKNVLNQ